MRLKSDGGLGSLFINRKTTIPLNEWLDAEAHRTKNFAYRKGWHCTFLPYAPHLKQELSNGEKRVWVECEIEDFCTYDRPESQGGQWILANRMKVIQIISNEEVNNILNN